MPRSEIESRHDSRAASPGKLRSFLLRLLVLIVLGAVLIVLLAHAGSFLIINNPQRSDVMVVLEGGADTSRYAHAVKIQRQGYAPRILLDADITREIYGKTEAEMVTDYLKRTGQSATEICPTQGDSTYSEVVDVLRCLQPLHVSSALIVTSDFHTRRALSIYQKRLPQYQWSVAASSAPFHDADQYWKHRAWAKSVLDEWEKYLWWKCVDQWRSDAVLR